MDLQEFRVLHARLSCVERRLRMVVLVWVLSVVGLVLLGVVVQRASSQPAVLRARTFEVVDATGRARLVLTVFEGEPELRLLDIAGRSRLTLDIFEGEPGLRLWDATGKSRLTLSMFEGQPSLLFRDRAGKARIVLTTGEGSMLRLYDPSGRLLFRAP